MAEPAGGGPEPSTTVGSSRWHGTPLALAVAAVALVGFALGFAATGGFGSLWGGDGEELAATAGPSSTTEPPSPTSEASTTSTTARSPSTTSTTAAPTTASTTTTAPTTTTTVPPTTSPPLPSTTTTDPAPPATAVAPGPPGSPPLLTVGFAGQRTVGFIVLSQGESRSIVLTNRGGLPLTWTARASGPVLVGGGASVAGVLPPGQSGVVVVTTGPGATSGTTSAVSVSGDGGSAVVPVVIR